MRNGVTDLDLQAAIPVAPPPSPGLPPGNDFRAAAGVIYAFFTGRLRERLFADARALGIQADAPRIVAAGYLALAAVLGLGFSLLSVLINAPDQLETHLLHLATMVLAGASFVLARRGVDPRQLIGWGVATYFLTVAVIGLNHAGVLPPVLWSFPVAAVVIATFVSARMKPGLIVMAVAAACVVLLTSEGTIGRPSPYSDAQLTTMSVIALSISTIGLGVIAWVWTLSRDYVLDQLKQANAAILESSSRSRIALEAAKVGLWDVPNIAERRFNVTESFHSITGYTAEEFNRCFNELGEFVHPDDIDALREAFTLGRKRMSRLRIDFRLKTRTRGYRWFSARAKYLRNADGTLRISGSLQDINFIKAAEDALRSGRDRAREANKSKSDFIAVMSHEVRTPLNAILGSVELLKSGPPADEARELVAMIDDAGNGLLAIANDMLDASRIEAGKIEIRPRAVDLAALVNRQVGMWRARAQEKGLELVADVSRAAAFTVMVDSGRLGQIIGNLLSNAVKFTDAGRIVVGLDMHTKASGRMGVEITVADSGRGVPASQAETIFEQFEQGEAEDRRGGAGLGLYISRRFARIMGGELALDETASGGAVFRLTLAVDIARQTSEASESAASAVPDWAGLHVLCVDDNIANRRIAELLLTQFGLKVVTRASGPEAIEAARAMAFDAILLDILMPGIDGIETLRRLRADPSGLNRETPALALTAKLAPDDFAAYLAAGFAGAAGKPIDVTELARGLAAILPSAPEQSEDDDALALSA